MKSIIPRDHEVRRLASSGSVLIWRRVKVQPCMCVPSSIAKVSGGLAQWREVDVPKYGCEEHAWLNGGHIHDECKCPHGATGETRWVKESGYWIKDGGDGNPCVAYRADNVMVPPGFRWKPSTTMPSWASRFRVTLSVSCRRIQSVTDFEAFTSGAPSEVGRITGPYCMSYVQGLRSIIESRNPGSWERGDWFWAIECKEEK